MESLGFPGGTTMTQSGRLVKRPTRYEHQQFVPGSNNGYTRKRRRIDSGAPCRNGGTDFVKRTHPVHYGPMTNEMYERSRGRSVSGSDDSD